MGKNFLALILLSVSSIDWLNWKNLLYCKIGDLFKKSNLEKKKKNYNTPHEEEIPLNFDSRGKPNKLRGRKPNFLYLAICKQTGYTRIIITFWKNVLKVLSSYLIFINLLQHFKDPLENNI